MEIPAERKTYGGGAAGEWTSGLGKRVVAGGVPKSYSAGGEVL